MKVAQAAHRMVGSNAQRHLEIARSELALRGWFGFMRGAA